jgi:hypothetical protein
MLVIFNRGITKEKIIKSEYKNTILLMLFSIIIAISYLLVSIYIFEKEIALTIPGRKGASAPFSDFVFYGGFYGKEKILNLLFGSIKQFPNPINYYTANTFLGLLPLSCIILLITNYKSLDVFSKKIVKVLITNVLLIILFTLPSTTFLEIIFNLPGMHFVRHTSYYWSAITFLLILLSVILFNNLFRHKGKYQYIFLYSLLTLTLIMSTITLLTWFNIFIFSLLMILFWRKKQVSLKSGMHILCYLFLIINVQITTKDVLKNYPLNYIRTSFADSDYYELDYDYFSTKRYSLNEQTVLDALSINNGLWGAQYPTDIFPANLDICDTDLRIDFLSQEVNNLYKRGDLPSSCVPSKFRLFKLIDNVQKNYSDDLTISNFNLKANSLSFNYSIENFEDTSVFRIEYQDSYSRMWTLKVNDKLANFLDHSGFKTFEPMSKSGKVEMEIKLFYLLVFQAGNLNLIFILAWILLQQLKYPPLLITPNSSNLNLKKA